MARISIPLDALTSRINLGDRFSGLRNQSLASRFANIKPISEFLDIKRLSKPNNFGEIQSRVNYNLAYFSSNYAVVFVMLSIYSLITNFWLLFDIIFVVFGMWFIGKLKGGDLEIGTFKATTSQMYTGLLCIAVPIGFFSSPFTTILWLIGASGVSILGHASLMDRPIENAFSEEAV
jgi:PRA1 family protein 1